MANEIKVGNATITLSDPEFRSSQNAILLAVGRCKDGALVTRSGETITFYPQVGPDKPRRLRRVLDAIGGPPKFKIEHLEAHLSVPLGTFEFRIDPRQFERYRECHDFRAELYAMYVHCDAVIGTGAGRIAFSIDFPVGAYVRITGKPVCCPDKPDIYDEIGPRHAPPEEAGDPVAKELYEKAKKKAAERERALDEWLEKGLKWKLELPGKYWLDPDWGFKFDYEKAEREKNKPIFRIKPKWGF